MISKRKKEDYEEEEGFGTGWIPQRPDLRDYTIKHPEISAMSRNLGWSEDFTKHIEELQENPQKEFPNLPTNIDLKPHFGPVRHQGGLNSCCAHAAVGIVEYFVGRATNQQLRGSSRFLYKTTRNLMGLTGNTGTTLRDTMKALVLCGCAPERYWPYRQEVFDDEPPAFVYAIADNYEAVRYFSYANPFPFNDYNTNAVLFTVKAYLAMGIPSMFGFAGFESTNPYGGCPYSNGEIYYPCLGIDVSTWSHAVIAVGYDDNKSIGQDVGCSRDTMGALLIRNSWGPEWGYDGYGWLPYDYILDRFAQDFWAILSMKWINSGQFGL